MELLTRFARVRLNVFDASPRRRLPTMVVLVVLTVAALWPEWLFDLLARRYRPPGDGVVEVLSARTFGR